jgi:hypothetical protein
VKTLHVAKVIGKFSQFTDPVILEQTGTTRRFFYAEVYADDDGVVNLRGNIICERKGKDGWQPFDGVKLSQMKAGEISKLELRTEHLKKLIVGLDVLKAAIEEKGIELGGVDLVVGRRNEMMRVDEDQKTAIEQLINNDHGADFWASLSSLRPDLTSQLADAEILRRRKTAVAQFENELQKGQWSETDWEKFFHTHQWIFGWGCASTF